MKKVSQALIIIFIGLVCPSCSYTLKLNGSQIPKNMKTLRVEFFENNAALVVNNLSTTFTEAIKTRIRNTTSLSVVTAGEADGVMSGSITDYNIAPVSIPATNNNVAHIANASRLTITVNVKYTCDLDKKSNFESSFTKFENFTGDINAQEQTLIADITKQLTEDIFNKAFENW